MSGFRGLLVDEPEAPVVPPRPPSPELLAWLTALYLVLVCVGVVMSR